MLVLLLVPSIGWYRSDRAHYDYWQGMEKVNKDEPGALARLQAAVNADSSMMVYQLALGQEQATEFIKGGKSDRYADRQGDHPPGARGRARSAQRSGARQPREGVPARRPRRRCRAQRRQIARLAVYHVPPVLLAGEVYEEIGRTSEAVDTYGEVISMDAGLADSAFWQGTAFRRDHFDEILPALVARASTQCTAGRLPRAGAPFRPERSSLAGLDVAAEGCKFLLFASYPND